MTLSFSTKFPDKSPTLFVEKIWEGFISSQSFIDNYGISEPMQNFLFPCMEKMGIEPIGCLSPTRHEKIHTIRKDEKDRWKVGTNIHFVINNRTKNRFQFAPILQVKSIQKIEIIYSDWYKVNGLFEEGKQVYQRCIETHIDGWVHLQDVLQQTLDFEDIEYIDYPEVSPLNKDNPLIQLVLNDGFDNVVQFYDWFDSDFEGKIIHWTDFSY